MTTTFVIEAMAAANAQLRWKRREQEEVGDITRLSWTQCCYSVSIPYENYTYHGNVTLPKPESRTETQNHTDLSSVNETGPFRADVLKSLRVDKLRTRLMVSRQFHPCKQNTENLYNYKIRLFIF